MNPLHASKRRVLISNLGSLGDIIPFLDLGKRLLGRGHDVSFATTSNYRAQIEASGLTFRAIGSARRMEDLHADPDLWHPKKGMKLMFDLAVELAEPSRSLVEEGLLRSRSEGVPFVAVGGMLSFGLRLARDLQRFPLMTLYLSPFLMRSRYQPPVLPGLPLPSWLPGPAIHRIQRLAERFVVDPERLPALNALRVKLGLEPIRNLSDWLPSPDRLCLTAPPWFAPPQPDWLPQTRQTGFPRVEAADFTGEMSSELVAFLRSGEKPVVVTYGSTMRHGRDFFRTASRVCAEAGRRAVLVTGDAESVVEPRRLDQFVERSVPFGALLPHAGALIHHGGIGTCFEAFAAGIPQMVVPNGFDQHDNAARIAKLGLGVDLSRRAFTRRGVSALSRMMTDPEIRRSCADARRHCAQQDGIADACTLVEAMSQAMSETKSEGAGGPLRGDHRERAEPVA